MNNSNNLFDEATIKAFVMEKPAEDALCEYARQNRCPRCNTQRLQPLGEVKGARGPIGILVCHECEFGVYVESAGSTEQRARDILVRNASSLTAGDLVELENLIADKERLEKLVEIQIDTLAHFGETLEAVEGCEEFGDLVLRILKERDRLQESLVVYATPEQAREAIGPQAFGMKQPEHPGLDLVKDKPATLVVGARILARALDRPVYLTRLTNRHGGIAAVLGPWTITIERDRYGSLVAIEPDGSALACEVLT